MLQCEGACGDSYHCSCLGISESECKMVSSKKNFMFLCDTCRLRCDVSLKGGWASLLDEKLIKLKRDMQVGFDAKFEELSALLRDSLAGAAGGVAERGDGVRSYSAAVRALPSFVVQPKETGQTVSDTKSKLFEKVNPVQSRLPLAGVRGAGGGGVVVSCENVEDCSKLMDLATNKMSKDYDIKRLTPLNPRVKVVGFSEEFDADSLVSYLESQNRSIFANVSSCKVVSIKCLRKDAKRFQAVLQVDQGTYDRLLESGQVIIGYDMCRVYDAIELLRCFKCCGFHHTAAKCSKPDHICPRCAEKHKLSECSSDALKCVNCALSNAGHGTGLSVDHAAWDGQRCHIYREALSRLRVSIIGGSK